LKHEINNENNFAVVATLVKEVVRKCYPWCNKGRQILLRWSSAKMIRLY